jgi:hypothetical protein
VSELEAGDRVALARQVPEPSAPERWPDDRVVLLGQLIGDGSYLKNAPMRYTTASEENSAAVTGAATREFDAKVTRYAGRGSWHQLLISGNGNRWKMAALRGTAYGGSAHFKFAPSRETLSGYARLLESPELALMAESDLFWDRIVAIEEAGEEEVFDLTVPGPACWLADGIVSHNSGQIEQDSDLVMFIYREEYYLKEESERPGEADIIIAKHRNGPVGDVVLTFQKQYPKFMNFAGDRFTE